MKKLTSILFLFMAMFIHGQDKDQALFLLRVHQGELSPSELEKEAGEFKEPDLDKFIRIILMPEGKAAVDKLKALEESTLNKAVKEASLYRISNYYKLIGNEKRYTNYVRKLKKEFPASEYLLLLGEKKSSKDASAKNNNDPENKKDDKNGKWTEGVNKEDDKKASDEKTKHAGDWYIQVAAYTNEKKADETVKKLKKNGFDVIKSEGKSKGKDFIFVSVGYYKSKDDAKADAVKIEKLLKTEVLVKKRS